MNLFENIVSGKEKLSLVGLGYVGMPIAVAFARKIKVVGFDLNEKKIELYKSGADELAKCKKLLEDAEKTVMTVTSAEEL